MLPVTLVFVTGHDCTAGDDTDMGPYSPALVISVCHVERCRMAAAAPRKRRGSRLYFYISAEQRVHRRLRWPFPFADTGHPYRLVSKSYLLRSNAVFRQQKFIGTDCSQFLTSCLEFVEHGGQLALY